MMEQDLEFSAQSFSKIFMHCIRYPHSVCGGFLLSQAPPSTDSEKNDQIILCIVDCIPVFHASHGLSPNIETAFNAISNYAKDQNLRISGYYQTERNIEGSSGPDAFSQKIMNKICDDFPRSVLCIVNFESNDSKSMLAPHQLIDNKWKLKLKDSFRVEIDPENLCKNIVYSKERLYRQIVDFDEHFDDISLDWTNSKISQRIDHLVANNC